MGMEREGDGTHAAAIGPMDVGQLLDASIKLVRRNFAVLVGCVLVVSVPLAVVSAMTTIATTSPCLEEDFCEGAYYLYDSDGAEWRDIATTAVTTVLLFILGQVACFRAVAEGYLGRRATLRQSLGFAARNAPRSVLLGIVYLLGVTAASLALLLPGIWLAVLWIVAYPVLLVERVGPVRALGRSRELVAGRWWATFGRFVLIVMVVGVVMGLFGFAISALLLLPVDEGSDLTAWIDIGLSSVLVELLVTPLVSAATVLIYFDLRVRKEGFDLALLAEQMGGPPAVDAAPVYAPAPVVFTPPVAPEAPSWAPERPQE